MRVRTLVLVSAAALVVTGCATPIIGAITLSELSTIAGVTSTITTGKGLTDHALSLLTGKDCSITEGLLRSDRDICEPRGSLATKDDFKGVFAYFDRKNQEGEPGDKALQRYAAARNGELAEGQGETAEAPMQVIEANASTLDLRHLAFFEDLSFDSGSSGAPAVEPAPIMVADAGSAGHVTLLTFRDTDRDGTPRIVSRHVYMMDPIPDSQAVPTATAATTPTTPTTPTTAPAPVATQAAAPTPSTPAVAAVAPAPATPATPATAATAPVKAQPAVAKPAPVRAQPASQTAKATSATKVYWYLSGR